MRTQLWQFHFYNHIRLASIFLLHSMNYPIAILYLAFQNQLWFLLLHKVALKHSTNYIKELLCTNSSALFYFMIIISKSSPPLGFLLLLQSLSLLWSFVKNNLSNNNRLKEINGEKNLDLIIKWLGSPKMRGFGNYKTDIIETITSKWAQLFFVFKENNE